MLIWKNWSKKVTSLDNGDIDFVSDIFLMIF